MKRLEVSGAVRPLYRSLGVEGLNRPYRTKIYYLKGQCTYNVTMKRFRETIVGVEKQ